MKKTPAVKKKPAPGVKRRLNPVSLAIPTPLLNEIRHAAKMMGVHQSEVQRLTMQIGLRVLRNCKYDLSGAVIGAARGMVPELIEPTPTAMREDRRLLSK